MVKTLPGKTSWFAAGVLTFMAPLLLAASALGADPVQFATLSGQCGQSSTLPAQASSRTDTAVKVTYSDSGDILWQRGPSLTAGQPQSFSPRNNFCSGSWVASFADVPTPPTTFSGRVSSERDNQLLVRVPAEAVFVGDLTIDQGSVNVGSSSCFGGTAAFASSGQAQLGAFSIGTAASCLQGRQGPPTSFSMTIRPLPATPATAAFAKPSSVPGVAVSATYMMSGDASVTATVRNQAGQVVRTLASQFAVLAGSNGLTWDGRDAAGNAVADGSYALHIAAADVYGGSAATASSPLVIDGTAPAVSTSQTTISPTQALTFAVSDAGSGVEGARVSIDGTTRYSGVTLDGGTLTIRPDDAYSSSAGRWKTGAHTYAVTATDKLGNAKTYTAGFNVSTPAPSTAPPSGGTGGEAVKVGTLKAFDARVYARRIMRRHGWAVVADSARDHRISCSRRSRLRFRCKLSGFVGDSSFAGSGEIWYRPDPDDDTFHYRIVVREYDEYCYATHRRNRLKLCSKRRIWRN